ncbi:hypothetical protein B0H13DRAFT_1879312 [Mycena leptocephala]|nr:hypothetical protein B0H13DRAFT_1879312 [Mycena leptocephala]
MLRSSTRSPSLLSRPSALVQPLRVCVGDVLVPESIADAVKSCATTCIIHSGKVTSAIDTAARYPTGPPLPHPTPAEVKARNEEIRVPHKKVNTDGMRNVLAAVLEGGMTQLVYIGNPDVVFDGRDHPMLRETDAPYPQPYLRFHLASGRLTARLALLHHLVAGFDCVNAMTLLFVLPGVVPTMLVDLPLHLAPPIYSLREEGVTSCFVSEIFPPEPCHLHSRRLLVMRDAVSCLMDW